MAHYELDARGKTCPLPLLETKRQMAGMAAGDSLRVLVTDLASDDDFIALSSLPHCRLVTVDAQDGARRYWLEKR